MSRKVIVFDTSILCVYLQVPGKKTCGSNTDLWDKDRVDKYLEEQIKNKASFILPFSTIIETGNHIAQARQNRYQLAKSLALLIEQAATMESPWISLDDQQHMWGNTNWLELLKEWPETANQKISMGDLIISKVAVLYAKLGFTVKIFTGDQLLESLEPIPSKNLPRRDLHK